MTSGYLNRTRFQIFILFAVTTRKHESPGHTTHPPTLPNRVTPLSAALLTTQELENQKQCQKHSRKHS